MVADIVFWLEVALVPIFFKSHEVNITNKIDPNQLPPTVISMTAQRYSYNRSLFERLQNTTKAKVHLLRSRIGLDC
jgi:hypothetical protein